MADATIVPITLTDPGEGLTEAEILEIKVAVGDTVAINDPVVEVETAKSAVELPSHVAGTVVKVLVAVGDEVPVGTPLLEIDTAQQTAQNQAAHSQAGQATSSPAEQSQEEPRTLVGYGSSAPSRRRRRATGASTAATHTPATDQQDQHQQVPVDRILAKPPVRKLAKDLGIALADVLATGPDGTVTREDVLSAQQRSLSGDTVTVRDGEYFPDESPQAPEDLGDAMKSSRHQPFPGVTTDERTTRVPIRSVRKRTAEAMVASAFTAPHVTVFNEVDITDGTQLLAQLKASREWKDVKLSPLTLVAKALLVAIRRNPEVNASWDEDAQEIVYKHYVNLGIAAATPRGLIVPNIKDAHLMTLRELADAIDELARTARAGRTTVSDTRDGTITITNFGVFGIDSGTPILNPGESVILGVGAIKDVPRVIDGQVVPRKVVQLAASFDHRLIDGALGAELLRDVSAVLEQPALGLVWG